MTYQFLRVAASRTATAVGAAVIATVVVAGGLSVAQAATESVANNSVNSAKIVNNSVQGADIKNGTVVAVDLANSVRPRWAQVDNTGFLLRDRGAASAARTGVGFFTVTFDTPVAACRYTATLGDPEDDASSPGEISVQEFTADPLSVVVRTYDSGGTSSDPGSGAGTEAFTLAVHC